jgi:hypothetical protein
MGKNQIRGDNMNNTNTMIRDSKDLKEQSKIVEKMSTNQDVKKNGKTPDPIQYKEIKRNRD